VISSSKKNRRLSITELRAQIRGAGNEEVSSAEAPRAALYCRVSSDSSVESNLSIPSQEELLRKHCAAEGILVHHVYKDEGVSGSTDQRKAFQKMIAAACNPEGAPFQFIFVHSTSRFARNTSDFLAYERQLALNGVEVRSITQKFSKDTGGFISKRVTTMFDEFHSIRTSVDVRRARLHMAREGIWPGCQPPFGYKLAPIGEVRGKVRNHLVVDEEQRTTVELIYRLAQYGDGQGAPLGIKAIVTWLNSRGYATRQGGRWSVNAVHCLLTNSVYKGEYRFNQRTRLDEFSTADLQQVVIIPAEPIIEPERFEEVQQLLERRRPKREGKLISSPLLLAGIAYCKCGSAMTLRTDRHSGFPNGVSADS
jgi:site-specific DNA recombinase